MGKFIIFLYPPHPLSPFDTSLALPLQSHVHCGATATAVILCLNHRGRKCTRGHIHSRPECTGKFFVVNFLQEKFGVQFLPEGSAAQWEGGVVSALYVLQVRVLTTCIFLLGPLRNLFY